MHIGCLYIIICIVGSCYFKPWIKRTDYDIIQSTFCLFNRYAIGRRRSVPSTSNDSHSAYFIYDIIGPSYWFFIEDGFEMVPVLGADNRKWISNHCHETRRSSKVSHINNMLSTCLYPKATYNWVGMDTLSVISLL